MAIYHLSVKMHTRPKSIFGAIAYRTGGVLQDPETKRTFDYSRKTGVVKSKVILCAGAPEEWKDRNVLWSAVEQKENISHAQLAREFEISLPRELSEKDQIALADWYAHYLAKQGMCVDYSVHSPDKKGKNHNPHVHMMCTTRPIDVKTGNWAFKERKEYALDASGNRIPILDADGKQKIGARGRKLWKRVTVQANPFNDKDKLLEWRQAWEKYANLAFEQRGLDARIDCRSLEEQGVDRVPLVSEGAELRIRERGVEPVKKTHEQNEEIKRLNAKREQLKQEIKEDDDQLDKLESEQEEEQKKAIERLKKDREIKEKIRELGRERKDQLEESYKQIQEDLENKQKEQEERRRAEEQAKKEQEEKREPTFDDFYAKLPADETYYEDYKRYWMSYKDDIVYTQAHTEIYRRYEETGLRSPVERLEPQFYEVRKDYEDTFLGDLKKLKIKSATLISKVIEKTKSVFSKVSSFFSKDTEEKQRRFNFLERQTTKEIKEQQAENAYDKYKAKREQEERRKAEEQAKKERDEKARQEKLKKEREEKRRRQKMQEQVDRGEVVFVYAIRPELKKRIKQHSYTTLSAKSMFSTIDLFLLTKSELQACADLIQDDDTHFFKSPDDVQRWRELSKRRVCEFAGVAEEFAEKYVCAVVCNDNTPAMMLAKQKAVDFHMCDMEHTEFYISSKKLQSCERLIADESVKFYEFTSLGRGHQLSRKEVCKLAGVREVKVQAPERSQGFHM